MLCNCVCVRQVLHQNRVELLVSAIMSSKSSVNGLNPCLCCPYGFHIETDFVRFCEDLVTALYGSNKRMSQTLQCRTTNSLRRKINSAFSTLNSCSAPNAATDAFLSYCDYNYNNITANRPKRHNNKVKNHSTIENNHCLDRDSINSLINDYSLGDAVDQFEEAWNESNESHRRLSNVSDCESLNKPMVMIETEKPSSPPASPAPSSCTSSNISRVVLSQIRDQMALSLSRVKELEDQVKHIPNLRQKVIVLREEKRKLIQKLEGGDEVDHMNAISDPQSMARLRELEKIGLITPPMMRRKLLMKSESDTEEDEFGDLWVRPSPPPSKMISSKNIRLEELNNKNESLTESPRKSLELVSVATNTETVQKAPVVNCSTNTDQKQTNEHKLSFDILDSISINPEPVAPIVTAQVAKRSIGISTSLAPSLPRKSVAIETELKACDTISLSELEAKRPALVSWGTDPMRVDYNHAQCQTSTKSTDVSTKTEAPTLKSVGVFCSTKDFGLKVNWSQTDRKVLTNKIVQCSQGCPKCELKQTETVGVGDDNIYGIVSKDKSVTTESVRPTSLEGLLSVSPVSRASSAQSIRLCDKCNDTINSVAKDFVIGPISAYEKISSPTIQSRIPRPIHSTGSLERRTIDDKIIEETANEILVYKNPSLSVGSSPIKPNAPLKIKDLNLNSSQYKSNELSPKTSEAIKVIEDVFKISESDESEDEMSSSSDEGTYEVQTGALAKPVVRKRIEPSKEIKAALKVLNDSLIKPEKANKSASIKSLSIIEKEWFKVAADKTSDPHTVEGYIDCFETFSKHLLNRVVNLDDKSGNTAIHYAISHNNFDIVSVLLDSKVCDVNKTNKAGYTATMLVSLAKVHNETQKAVIRRLFQLGDVNIKAKQNGQTALMLAASHGQFFTCKILLECGAAINLQDNDGSTALMCAAEHGHSDVVRLLLSHPDCDPTIVDNDCSTALKIAMANNHNDIGLMLYASTSMLSRGSSPYASLRRTQSKQIAASLRRTGSFSYGHSRVSPHTFQLAPSPPPRSRHSSTSTTRSAKH